MLSFTTPFKTAQDNATVASNISADFPFFSSTSFYGSLKESNVALLSGLVYLLTTFSVILQ